MSKETNELTNDYTVIKLNTVHYKLDETLRFFQTDSRSSDRETANLLWYPKAEHHVLSLQKRVDVCYTELDEFRLHIHPFFFRTVQNPADHVLKFIPPAYEAYNNSNSQDLNNF